MVFSALRPRSTQQFARVLRDVRGYKEWQDLALAPVFFESLLVVSELEDGVAHIARVAPCFHLDEQESIAAEANDDIRPLVFVVGNSRFEIRRRNRPLRGALQRSDELVDEFAIRVQGSATIAGLLNSKQSQFYGIAD